MTELHYKGLTDSQVLESQKIYGSNILTPPKRDPWWKLFLEKFDDPVIRILLIAAIIAIGIGFIDGRFVEGVGIIVAVLLATSLAFINEYKAGKEFDILNNVNNDVGVKAIRNGNYCTIPKKEIVVGDIVLIEVGDEIPADGEILESVSLQIDESKFTGESVPVKKFSPNNVENKKIIEPTYPANLALRGAMVVEGHGILGITKVGDQTEVGKITTEASIVQEESTPLNQQLEKLSKLIGVVGFGIAAITLIALIIRGNIIGEITLSGQQWIFFYIAGVSIMIAMLKIWLPIYYDFFELIKVDKKPPRIIEEEGFKSWIKVFSLSLLFFLIVTGIAYSFQLINSDFTDWMPAKAARDFLNYIMIAVTIIVVAVPEGLAMSVTLSLAYSMRKMTATNNLVRKMHACETIGAANIICSDKTGTLTKNQMNVFESSFLVLNGDNVPNDFIAEMISVNSTANLSHNENGVVPLGNPTEGALLLWLNKHDHDYVLFRDQFKIIYQITFNTERKYMGTYGVSAISGRKLIYLKGAPEILLEKCSTILESNNKISPLNGKLNEITNQLNSYQKRGMRTLGFAYSEEVDELKITEPNDSIDKLTWVGFTAIADPVRDDVKEAINICILAGIDVKIVTGDNPETAEEIAKQIGLIDDNRTNSDALMTGVEFNTYSDDELKIKIKNLKILSRARPMDKLRLVSILKGENNVVAVTGDGSNDAPALNRASVGLAMGSGTAVAKEASDIILLDDSFSSIVNAVNWGRSLYQNIQRFIIFQLTINVAALSIALLGPFIGISLPFTVTQMLWINLIMDTFAALALATEPPHKTVMTEKPRDPNAFIVTSEMAKSILGYGFTFVIISIIFLLVIMKDDIITDYELSAFYATFVMLQFWNLFNARCLGLNSSCFDGLLENKLFLMIAGAIFIGQIVIIAIGGEFFRIVPLSIFDWIYIICGSSTVLLFGEIFRFIKRMSLNRISCAL